jgi:hypothetical protein
VNYFWSLTGGRLVALVWRSQALGRCRHSRVQALPKRSPQPEPAYQIRWLQRCPCSRFSQSRSKESAAFSSAAANWRASAALSSLSSASYSEMHRSTLPSAYCQPSTATPTLSVSYRDHVSARAMPSSISAMSHQSSAVAPAGTGKSADGVVFIAGPRSHPPQAVSAAAS